MVSLVLHIYIYIYIHIHTYTHTCIHEALAGALEVLENKVQDADEEVNKRALLQKVAKCIPSHSHLSIYIYINFIIVIRSNSNRNSKSNSNSNSNSSNSKAPAAVAAKIAPHATALVQELLSLYVLIL